MRFSENEMEFDVVPETFARTNLGSATIVNVERALAANDRFEGHVVQGHVDGTTKLIDEQQRNTGKTTPLCTAKRTVSFLLKRFCVRQWCFPHTRFGSKRYIRHCAHSPYASRNQSWSNTHW